MIDRDEGEFDGRRRKTDGLFYIFFFAPMKWLPGRQYWENLCSFEYISFDFDAVTTNFHAKNTLLGKFSDKLFLYVYYYTLIDLRCV